MRIPEVPLARSRSESAIADSGAGVAIETVRGLGYRLVAEEGRDG